MLNRFADDGKVSALMFFRAVGFPIFRLRTQLRMARGLFDICHREVYKGLPFQYGPGSDINLPHHTIGRELERYVQTKYPSIQPPPEHNLREFWVHCEGARVTTDRITKPKRSRDQVKIALDFPADFVATTGVDAAEISVVLFYRANLDILNRMRKRPEYRVLDRMPAAHTVDSFQGQEGKISVVIMGTSNPNPGFTAQKNRLNVALSRQTSGLAIFGDINVVGGMGKSKEKCKGKGKGKGKGKETDKVLIDDTAGERRYVKISMLKSVTHTLSDKWPRYHHCCAEEGGERGIAASSG
ncbi:hypothetical protein PT974_09964 [Cladobotryum mycophilum]|uniref:DNA2/NAM7 helicase-like C-terminal domain-containing protein n=1 Tax=Cladobotryum mycophilum TaxID=491253 RepID=A0ABR0S8I8_9HYPO